MTARPYRLGGIASGLLAAAALIAAGCGSGSGQPAPASSVFPGAAAPSGSWPYPNSDPRIGSRSWFTTV
jgi:hypothetical protein